MTLGKRLFCCFFILCQWICAQEKPVALDEVKISDLQLKHFSDSKSVTVLNDSVIRKNQTSLTSLLNFNSVVYFKENGSGMVSSPSFRGTTAQQTAVIWNGININSQINGLTDFNAITTKDFSSIIVRAGGGSGIYGSGAIGGTIHLNNEMAFGEGLSNDFQANYGSFNTAGIHYGAAFSTQKFSSQLSVSRNNSDNDYRYVHSDLKNENGGFYNTSYNIGFGYKIDPSNFVKLYSQVFDSKRHFSLISPTDSKTMYKDLNTRSLLEWSSFFDRFVSKVKLAFLTEKYQYFENISLDGYTFGKVETLIAKYDLAQHIGKNMQLNYIVDFTQSNGNGSDIPTEKRQVTSATILFKHKPILLLAYDLSIRKEITSNYESPVLFSAGAAYSFSELYRLRFNVSTNFRMPSFNDLYWQGLGNTDLKPESSRQIEVGNDFTFKNFRIAATVYATKIRDMIRWLPGNGGIFTPDNTNKVSIFGAEILLNAARQIGKNRFELSGTYAYTNSENEASGKQLIYVPYHKATAAIGYSFAKFSANLQYLFVGKVFTQSDNNPLKRVPLYHLSNIGFDYDFGKKNGCELGFNIRNVGNVNYQSVESRFMPGRHYNVFLNLKF